MAFTYIDSLRALLDFISKKVEVMIFPSGDEGRLLLDFFNHKDRIHRICCVATEGDSSVNNLIYTRPIVPIHCLPHFRETANMLVAAPSSDVDGICNRLNEYGFKNIFGVGAGVFDELQSELTAVKTSNNIMNWYMERLVNQMSRIEHYSSMQNEICRVNTAAFENYRERFRGRKVVVAGCGPTLQYYKRPMPDAIHISLNRAFLNENIPFDYLFAHDPGGSKKLPPISASFDLIRDKAFIGQFAKVLGGKNYSEWMSLVSDKVARYYLDDNKIGQPIYRDICCHPLTDFWSIFSAALQFAFFTHPAEIYLVGCDASLTGHFYQYTEADSTSYWLNTTPVKIGYARFKLFGEEYYPDTKIISLNPVGLKDLFKDIYTDEYKASLVNNGSNIGKE